MGTLRHAWLALLRRDLLLAVRQRGQLANPLLFFVLVVTLFPLGLNPEPALLRTIGPGVAHCWQRCCRSTACFAAISTTAYWSSC